MTDRFVKPAQLLIVDLCSEVDETGGPDRATHLWNALMVTVAVGLLKRSRQELESKRAKKKSNMVNNARIEACLSRFDRGSYSRLQFLHAVSHSIGAHTDALQPHADSSDSDDDADVVDLTNAGPATPPASSAPTSSAAAAAAAAPDDCCEVCLVEPRQGPRARHFHTGH